MAKKKKRFLLGKGEELVTPTEYRSGWGNSRMPYPWKETVEQLQPQLTSSIKSAAQGPEGSCPEGQTVLVWTLHPSFTSKSAYPAQLLDGKFFDSIGSRSRTILPKKTNRKKNTELYTAEIYVRGSLADFNKFAEALPDISDAQIRNDIGKIEEISFDSPEKRIKCGVLNENAWEIVLHARDEDDFVLEGFRSFLSERDIEVPLDKRFQIGGLCFIPLRFPESMAMEVAQYSFIRAVRPMPLLRPITSSLRNLPTTVTLPDVPALSKTTRVAVLDAGLPSDHPLDNWVRYHDSAQGLPPVSRGLEHGHAVTSAALFGNIVDEDTLPQPYANIDHYRVLSADDTGFELPEVLRRIEAILNQGTHQFVNISLGPDLPVDDDDISLWTAKLDQLLSDGNTFMSIAAGNNGELDSTSGNARIQIPSDSVNALAVGAWSHDGDPSKWTKAAYSAIGPGRSPGIVKPDLLAFGGCEKTPFRVLNGQSRICNTSGTSFASPLAMRTAVGIHATTANSLRPLAIKALLINTIAESKTLSRKEMGWGRLNEGISQILVCGEDEVRVVYQGTLPPSKCFHALLPMPPAIKLKGDVTITATFCYACEVDPEDTPCYTKSGLDIVFHPNKTSDDTTKTFFPKSLYQTEDVLRHQFHKWETVRHNSNTFRSSSLDDPWFYIHHIARDRGGAATHRATKLPYALVVHIRAPRVVDLYDQVQTRYQGVLEEIIPVQQEIQYRT